MSDEPEHDPTGGLIAIWRKRITAYLADMSFARVLIPFSVVVFLAHMNFWMVLQAADWNTRLWWVERHPYSHLSHSLEDGYLAASTSPTDMGKLKLPDLIDYKARCLDHSPESEDACLRVSKLTFQAESMSWHHFWIMRWYMNYQMAFLVTAYLLGTFDMAVVAVVLKKGFDNASGPVKAAVLGLSVSTAFFGGFPTVMSMESNIAANKKLYTDYWALWNASRSYALTGETMDGARVPPESFVHELDLAMTEINQVHIEVDASYINVSSSSLPQAGGIRPMPDETPEPVEDEDR